MASEPPSEFETECFLISPIGDEDSDGRRRADRVRDYIVKPAVEELGLSAVRADDIAEPGQITLQVISHVREAKAAVADLTGANANVFYELAIRHTASLPVALIAHQKDRGQLPFDIAQMRTIFYDHQDLKSAADCKAQISEHLREALEKGAVDSPVAASVNLARLQVGNPSEQVIAQLVSTVEDMASETSATRHAISALADQMQETRIDPDDAIALVKGFEVLQQLSDDRSDDELTALYMHLVLPVAHLSERIGPTVRPRQRVARRSLGRSSTRRPVSNSSTAPEQPTAHSPET